MSDRLHIYVDIETTGTNSNRINDHVIDSIKAPKNYTKPETIERYLADARETAWAETALLPHFGRIAVIGTACNDSEPEIICDEDEARMLTLWMAWCKDMMDEHNKRLPQLVGYNVGFDLRFIWSRCLIHGIKPSIQLHEDAKPWSSNVLDLRYRLTCGDMRARGTLKDWCLALDLDIDDDDIDGADVPKAWTVEALRPQVMTHCYRDVARVQAIHEKLKAIGAG